MRLIEIIHHLNDENYPPWSSSEADALKQMFSEYGYQRDEDFPPWFSKMLSDVLARHTDQLFYDYDDTADSNMGSILFELHRNFGWNIDDEGEAATITFPVTRMRVLLSREARHPNGLGCNSLTISRLP